jgi:hypothetical protein
MVVIVASCATDRWTAVDEGYDELEFRDPTVTSRTFGGSVRSPCGRLIFGGCRRCLDLRFDAGQRGTTAWHERCFEQFGAETPKELGMATQIVMDHTGDTRHNFEAADTEALSKAEERFKALTSVGFTAAVRTAAGEVTVTRSFDPTAEETLFFPRLVGG